MDHKKLIKIGTTTTLFGLSLTFASLAVLHGMEINR